MANPFGAIIQGCAAEAYKYGFRYFGVEYRHECWTGRNGGMTYNMHGRSDNCLRNYGVGSVWTIFVYRFVEGKLPVVPQGPKHYTSSKNNESEEERKEGSKEGRKEGRKEGVPCFIHIYISDY